MSGFYTEADYENSIIELFQNMADEAHRSQYGLKEKVDAKTGEIKVGTARIIRDSLPNAT